MIKTFPIAAAALAAAAIASPSFAQSFSPSSGAVSGSGPIRIVQATSLYCNLSLEAMQLGPTSILIPTRTVSPMSQGSGFCLAMVPYGHWQADVVPGSSTSIALTLGFRTDVLQPCYGTVTASWNNATNTATINNAVLPLVNAGDRPCIISGVVRIPSLQVL